MMTRLTRFVRKKLSSIFTKLFFVSLTAWICVIIAVITAFFITRHDNEPPLKRNLSRYITYIISDIGTPPNLNKAREISAQTGIAISFQNNQSQWTTTEVFPEISGVRFRQSIDNPALETGGHFGHHYLRYTSPDGTYYFEYIHEREDQQRHKNGHLFLFALLSAIVIFSYLTVKRILKPLNWLGKGVSDVADGNLATQVPIKGNDELAELSRNFNSMTAKLNSMLKSRDQLLRDVSHELRSPLTRVRLACEMMEDSETKSDIIQDIAEMEEMIAHILESAKRYHEAFAADMSRCDLELLLRSVAEKYSKITPSITTTNFNEPTYIAGDRHGLQTLLTNLIDNAIKYSSHQEKPVELIAQRACDEYHILVRDYGIGIDAEDIDLLFEPFFRVDKSRSRNSGGYGLGLSICKAVVQAHNGTIRVESSVGGPTTFTVSFPHVLK